MQDRYRIFRRSGGNFYVRDKITGKSESLETTNRLQTRHLLAARNQASAQPQLNRSMAKAYLSAKSPDLLTRTWSDVMDHYIKSGVESTRDRKARAFRSRPFSLLCALTLLDTEAIHLLSVLEHKQAGNPFDYLKDLFPRLPGAKISQIKEFTPAAWARAKEKMLAQAA